MVERLEVVKNGPDDILEDLDKVVDLRIGQEDRIEALLLAKLFDFALIVLGEAAFLIEDSANPLEAQFLVLHLLVQSCVDELLSFRVEYLQDGESKFPKSIDSF